MFISIAIVDPKFLVIINVVKPVARMLVRPVYCVGAGLGLADTIFVEERARKLRRNGHHLSSKPDAVTPLIMKVNFNDVKYDATSDYFFELSKLKKDSSALGKAVHHALPSRRFTN